MSAPSALAGVRRVASARNTAQRKVRVVMASDPYCGRCHTWMKVRFVVHGEVQEWYCECPMGQAMGKDPSCHNASHDHHDPQSPIVLGRKSIQRAEDIADGIIKVGEGECTCGLDVYKAPEQHAEVCPIWVAAFTVADSQPTFGFAESGGPTDRPGGEFEAMPTGVYSAADGGPDNEGTICGHERLDGRCNFWGCPIRLANQAAEEARPREEVIREDAAAEEHKYHVAVFDNGTGEMLGWRPLRDPKIDEETRAELDAILRKANEKVED
ncbi:hypothetical protein LCGC14_2373830 [marine sediment metagenome]|uniref:Uncharacterized protein n=1 Tax=marine sediment metagenome TaxID=412755 RepID=A0A0F9EXJ7_9ZZZZ